MQGSVSTQLGGLPPLHWPLWQVSPAVQAFPSEQLAPFGMSEWTQPSVGLQASAVQGLLSAQFKGVPGWQIPAWQESVWVHELPSVHPVPSPRGTFAHPVVGLQMSTVQLLSSLQLAGPVETHAPP